MSLVELNGNRIKDWASFFKYSPKRSAGPILRARARWSAADAPAVGRRDQTPRDYPGNRFKRMTATRLIQHVRAPRGLVYRAFLDPRAVACWMVPDGMTSHVHSFESREGGSFRISLTYDVPTGTGKTTAHTDTHHGRFVKLVPDDEIVQVVEFETGDPSLRGEMTIRIRLTDASGGTQVDAVHDGLPPGLSPTDNETGWRMSLAKLAALVEALDREQSP